MGLAGRFAIVTFCAVMGSVSSSPARAADDEQQNEATPTRGDELEVSVGAGFIMSPRPYVGAAPASFPVPVLELRYKGWFFEGIRGGYALVRDDRWDVRALTQFQFQGLEPESSPFLEGMKTRGKSLDAGVEVLYRGRPVAFRMSAITDVLGRSNGQEVTAQAFTGAPLGKVLVLVGFGPRWLSRNRVDYYYGVREVESTPERPAYAGTSTVNWDLTVSAIYEVTPQWRVFGLWIREGLGSAIESSPLVERSATHSLIASVTYTF